MVLSKKIILLSCDHTFTYTCSFLVFSNILIPFEVKFSVTVIPFSFKTLLLLYIIFLVLYLTYFTIMGCGFAFLDYYDFQVSVIYQCFQVKFFDSYVLLLLLQIIHWGLHHLFHQVHKSNSS